VTGNGSIYCDFCWFFLSVYCCGWFMLHSCQSFIWNTCNVFSIPKSAVCILIR